MSRRIGRFEVRRELGRGSQSVVYLGFDPQLEREVAIKTLPLGATTGHSQLLDEARMVGRLRHPNIVPIFEAGEADGSLYLVFEYVPGCTLAEFMHQSGSVPPVKAVTLLHAILEAVGCAHGQGIIHRDLKPSNILLDEDGTPRVMDFGISIRRDAGATASAVGTPAYLSPEYVARQEISERGDLYAAGLILFELLTGRRAHVADSLPAMLQRIAKEDVRLPPDVPLDARLQPIVLKSVARDPALRYQTAGQFIEALDHYLDPETEQPLLASGRQSTVDFLLRRMRHKSDFPALSESVTAINRIASSDNETIEKLSNAILNDFALTNKLLRLVNSAYFRPAGGGSISTVSRAVVVLGFEAVRNIAVTVLLFEHLQNKANANQLKEDFLRATLAGVLARDLSVAAQMRDLEQVFICALFHNLGRLLAQFYFPEEADEIRRTVAAQQMPEESAAVQVLGISFEELGVAIARQWGFPPLIVGSMRALPGGKVPAARTVDVRMRVVAGYANELCTMLLTTPLAAQGAQLRQLLVRYAEAVELDEPAVRQSIEQALDQVTEFARIIHLDVQHSPFIRAVRQFGSTRGASVSEQGFSGTDEALDSTLLRDDGLLGNVEPATEAAHDAQAILAAGIQDISNTLVEGFKLNDILRIILETMYRAMGFRRVILCIRDAKAGVMQGRFGFGPDAMAVAKAFRFPLSFTPDIFHAATSKGVDLLISDIDDPKIAARIPDWYRKAVPARAFVLFPLNIKGSPVALIYADHDAPNGIVMPEKELSLLRTLRNQAVLAIKQGG